MRARRFTAMTATGLMALATVVGTGQAAVAKGEEIGGSGNTYLLSDTFGGEADHIVTYGASADEIYVGDWDGDGTDTLAYRRGATFSVRNSNSTGSPDRVFTYGRPGDVVLVGDWDGDGVDTFAVRRGKEYFVKNSLNSGNADVTFPYGKVDDTVLIGDWDGTGRDTFAVRRGREYFVKNSLTGGPADTVVAYGREADVVLVGDWDGNGVDTFTVRRGSEYHVANQIRNGNADHRVDYGRADDTALVGDWDGDGVDTFGLRRTGADTSTAPGTVTGEVVAPATAVQRDKLTGLLNDYRTDNGRTALPRHPRLDELAQSQARWMAENKELKHNSGLRAQMGGEWVVGSEIIVRQTWRGSSTSDDVLAYMHGWWRNSPVHDANMLRTAWNDRYTVTHVGTGYYVNEDGQSYGVHVFGSMGS